MVKTRSKSFAGNEIVQADQQFSLEIPSLED
jgi:hypothetical protein